MHLFLIFLSELKPGDGPEYLGVRSGFFFIENVFYNDMRDRNTDYSAVILEHNYQQQQQQLLATGVTTVPSYSAKRMDDVTFSQVFETEHNIQNNTRRWKKKPKTLKPSCRQTLARSFFDLFFSSFFSFRCNSARSTSTCIKATASTLWL